ncbi:hypothetical protein BD770DRAFT_431169 [Pilaira anomala]|nr:hypothetical protein BD770DRAFT_431169 [Pilaira anomala]
MRCSILIPSAFLVLLVAIFNVAVTEPVNNIMLTSDNIESKLVYGYFEKRAKGDHVATETVTATEETEDDQDKAATAGGKGSSEVKGSSEGKTSTKSKDSAESEGSENNAANESVKGKKKNKKPSSLASPAVLQDGTLFYIGTAVTCLLWVTGKAIDTKMDRQEKYAESLIHSI